MKTTRKELPSVKSLQIAGHLTTDDKQILRDHAATLKKQGTPAAARELERMNKMYSKYGMSFGSIKGV
jgi:hypothetical protein